MIHLELTAEQKQAIEQIDKNILVAAGAGSGKTLVLVRRFVEILKQQPQLRVQDILAVTYTRKAAKEMRVRIKSHLKELLEEASSKEEARRWQQCLADMDSACIDTIHSLCQSILQNFALEAGVDSEIQVLDDLERAQIIEETIEESLRQAIANSPLLVHFSPDDIKAFLQTILGNHLQFGWLAQKLQKLSTRQLNEELSELLLRVQEQIIIDLTLDEQWQASGNYVKDNPWSDPKSELETIRQSAAWCFKTIESKRPLQNGQNKRLEKEAIKEAWQANLALCDIPSMRTLGGASAKVLRDQIKTLIELAKDYSCQLPLEISSENNEQYWPLLYSLLALTDLAFEIYTKKKNKAQKLDYDDLIAKASAVIKASNSPVRRYYNETIAHILVDEFQDTNPLQAELLTMLAGPETKMFFIGDDKQSIYKFQGADVATFNAWQKKITADNFNDSLPLSNKNIFLEFEHSFRSTPPIVDFVNSVFSVLLHVNHAHVNYRARYRPLKSQRQTEVLSTLETIKLSVNQVHNVNETNNVEIMQLPYVDKEMWQCTGLSEETMEGQAVANWIKTKVQDGQLVMGENGINRPINYGDFAILVPRNSDFQVFESCLSDQGIPYTTSGGKTFLQRQEIYDLGNTLLFLSNPSDNHALLAILRSPMFGFTDDLIHNLVNNYKLESETIWQVLQKQRLIDSNRVCSVANSGEEPVVAERGQAEVASCAKPTERSDKEQADYEIIGNAVFILKRLLADFSVLTLSELIYRIIKDTNYDLIALNVPNGKQRYKNIWKFYALAGENKEMNAYQFAQCLDLSRQLSVEQTNAPIDSSRAVKLMTIHAAKGLEFPAVALPVLSSQNTASKQKLLFNDQFGIALNTTRTEKEREDQMPLPYQLSKILNDDMNIAEKKRLQYVAMTRAKDHLALFIKEKDRGITATHWLRPLLGNFSVQRCDLQLLQQANTLPEANKLGVNPQKAGDINNGNQLSFSLKHEELLEPIAIHLGIAPAKYELSPLTPRLTPSATHTEPEAKITGTFFHKIMEYLPQGKTILTEEELLILIGQMKEEVVHPQMIKALMDQGKNLLAIYAQSELQILLSKAKSVFHEWSYYKEKDNGLHSERPDLLIETADGQWYLIDYKTDRFPVEETEKQAKQYRKQLENYGQDFTALTSIKPQLAIYFAQHGLLHQLTRMF